MIVKTVSLLLLLPIRVLMLVILHHWNLMSLQVALLQLFDVVSELHRIQTPNMTSRYSIPISSCVSGNGESNSTSLSYEPSATPAYKPNTAPPNVSQVSFASFNQSTSVSVIKPAFSSPSIPTTHPPSIHPPTPPTHLSTCLLYTSPSPRDCS